MAVRICPTCIKIDAANIGGDSVNASLAIGVDADTSIDFEPRDKKVITKRLSATS